MLLSEGAEREKLRERKRGRESDGMIIDDNEALEDDTLTLVCSMIALLTFLVSSTLRELI